MSRWVMRRAAVAALVSVGVLAAGRVAGAAPPGEASASSEASAAEPEDEGEGPRRAAREPGRFALGLGTGVTVGLGSVWHAEGDVVGDEGAPVFVDFEVAPSYRVARDFALGLRAGVGLEPGSRGEASSSGGSVRLERRLWHLGVTGRYQAEPGRGPYLTLSAGAAALSEHRGDASASQWAPLVGAAGGYELSVARPVSLGLELRAAYAPFGEGPSTSPVGYYDYQVSTWLGAGLVGRLMP